MIRRGLPRRDFIGFWLFVVSNGVFGKELVILEGIRFDYRLSLVWPQNGT